MCKSSSIGPSMGPSFSSIPLPRGWRARRRRGAPTLPGGTAPPAAGCGVAPAAAGAPTVDVVQLASPPMALAEHAILCGRADALADDAHARLGYWAGNGIAQMTSVGALVVGPLGLALTLAAAPLASLALVGIGVAAVAAFVAVGVAIELIARRRRQPQVHPVRQELEAMAASLAEARARAAGVPAQVADLRRAEARVAAAQAALQGGVKGIVREITRGLVPGVLEALAATYRWVRRTVAGGAPARAEVQPAAAGRVYVGGRAAATPRLQ